MTVIVATRDSMFSDSRVSIAEKGFAYPAVKIIKANGFLIGASGEGGDCTRFLEWGKEGFKAKDEPKWRTPHYTEDEIVGLVVKKEGIYIFTQGGPELERVEAEFWAVGSGSKAARAALLLGVDPTKAVEIACEIDNIFCGLPVQSLKL